MSQQSLVNAIYSALTADTQTGGVSDLTDGRIYEAQAPQDEALPLLIFSVVTDTPFRTLDSGSLDALVQFDVFGNRESGSATARAITDRLYTLMQYQSLTVSGVSGVTIEITERGRMSVVEDSIQITTEARVQGTGL